MIDQIKSGHSTKLLMMMSSSNLAGLGGSSDESGLLIEIRESDERVEGVVE